ncbi:MAG: hypothetical protein CVV42_06130 [Candidatus Riflebacteria bacterium HGW-Riflebacteria-2]|jgi:hypothetical protein|nr:MAG: hypothetical protein CVV42_06130 [Candidatus Riflebacteria bacterium HGW-Riflebacteria-2]
MKKTANILLPFAFIAMLLVSCATTAAVNETVVVSSDASGRLMLEKRQEEGMMAREDRLFFERNGQQNLIFESEGRAVEQVLPADLDGDGSNEILIVMELGGSGDFRELALLQAKDGRYQQVWLETGFSAGKITVTTDAKNKKLIVIDYFTDDEPAKEARAIYAFDGSNVTLLQTTPVETGG